jgi:hypothetical protein
LRIDDGTGVTDIALDNQDPRQYIPRDTQEYVAEMLKAGQSSVILGEDLLSNIMGREIEVYGTAQESSTEGKLEFKAKRAVMLEKL